MTFAIFGDLGIFYLQQYCLFATFDYMLYKFGTLSLQLDVVSIYFIQEIIITH